MKKYFSLKNCFLVVAVALVAVYVFKVQWSAVFTFGILLLCPLMHLFMMKGMNHGEKGCHDDKKSGNIK